MKEVPTRPICIRRIDRGYQWGEEIPIGLFWRRTDLQTLEEHSCLSRRRSSRHVVVSVARSRMLSELTWLGLGFTGTSFVAAPLAAGWCVLSLWLGRRQAALEREGGGIFVGRLCQTPDSISPPSHRDGLQCSDCRCVIRRLPQTGVTVA